MNSCLPIRGDFYLQIHEVLEDGSLYLIEDFYKKNTIVDVGRGALCTLMGGTTSGQITKIGFGTSDSTPSVSDTALTSAYIKSLNTPTYPTSTSVQFAYTLLPNEAIGKVITEYGLYFDDGTTLFSRIIRTATTKLSNIQLSGTWRITLL